MQIALLSSTILLQRVAYYTKKVCIDMYYKLSTKKQRCKKRRQYGCERKPVNWKRRIKVLIIIVVILSIVYACVRHYIVTTRPLILSTAEATITAKTTLAVNSAVLEVMDGDITYDNLVTVQKDSNGDIALIQSNSQLINQLARETALSVQNSIDTLGEVGVEIAIGTLSGLPLLTGKGANISIAVQPVGSVVCTFISEFTSAGINQTLHQIYLVVDSDVTILLPTLQKVVSTNTPVLVSESIIIGKVPDVYLQGTILGSSTKTVAN